MFVDEVRVELKAGRGGDGSSAFLREAKNPLGGPAGGDGGHGGSVIFEADEGQNTLYNFRRHRHLRAKNGEPGQRKNMSGKDAEDMVMKVAAGTRIFDEETGQTLGDLITHGDRLVVARGGRGGRGNSHFVTATNQSPRFAEQGKPGEARRVRLELRLLADVGLLGYPSVGKSTLIRAISNAKPMVAAFPFTTLTPHLGVVTWKPYVTYVVADLPGLIEGASEGKGLGLQFLKHLERTRLLLHIIEVPPPLEELRPEPMDEELLAAMEDDERAAALAAAQDLGSDRDPLGDFGRINQELLNFSADLAAQPQVIALNKVDLPYVKAREPELRAHFEALGFTFLPISAYTGEGIQALVDALGARVHAIKQGALQQMQPPRPAQPPIPST
jgi:GTPase